MTDDSELKSEDGIIDFGSARKRLSGSRKFDWLRDVKRYLQKNYKKMYDHNNKEYNRLWQMYVDIEEEIDERNLPPLNLPNELEYPCVFDHMLKKMQVNYTEWHKREFKIFCEMMEETIVKIDDYIKNYEEQLSDDREG